MVIDVEFRPLFDRSVGSIRFAGEDSAPVVTIASADAAASSKQLARDLFVKLGMLPKQSELGMRLIEASGAGPAESDYLIEIGASGTSSSAASLVLLAGEQHAALGVRLGDGG